jgi:hypothetical protein
LNAIVTSNSLTCFPHFVYCKLQLDFFIALNNVFTVFEVFSLHIPQLNIFAPLIPTRQQCVRIIANVHKSKDRSLFVVNV